MYRAQKLSANQIEGEKKRTLEFWILVKVIHSEHEMVKWTVSSDNWKQFDLVSVELIRQMEGKGNEKQ